MYETCLLYTSESFVCAHAPYSLGFTVKREDHYTAGFEQRANKEWHVSKESIGTDRTTKGTNYVSQYFKYNKDIFNSLSQCPELYLLCFHNVPWSHKMKSGKSLREEFKSNLKRGIEQVDVNIGLWKSIRNKIDPVRYEDCLLYTSSGANNSRNSSFWSENGSFFRLKNVELSYTLANKTGKFIGKDFKFFVRGTDLFVLSGIKDLDPERML